MAAGEPSPGADVAGVSPVPSQGAAPIEALADKRMHKMAAQQLRVSSLRLQTRQHPDVSQDVSLYPDTTTDLRLHSGSATVASSGSSEVLDPRAPFSLLLLERALSLARAAWTSHLASQRDELWHWSTGSEARP